jgi:hypothetical protein
MKLLQHMLMQQTVTRSHSLKVSNPTNFNQPLQNTRGICIFVYGFEQIIIYLSTPTVKSS